ncbi:MAG: hypothetical protein K1X89_04795 [Myxococcaceae bacterium]|nr:hypothetical protein [Myxococcaceae bacterium]
MARSLLLALSVVVVCVSLPAAAQTCSPPAGWRAPLVFVCPNTPALASSINGNYGQIVAWLEAKVGQVGQAVALPAGAVVTPFLADGAVATAKVADGAVTTVKVADGAIGTAKLQDGSVTKAKLTAGGVAVYATSAQCSGSGTITFSASCNYISASCGTTCNAAAIPRYEDCNGNCPSAPALCGAQLCAANNTLRGYLVAP